MKQPDIKFSGEKVIIGAHDTLFQVANHWNIAKHKVDEALHSIWTFDTTGFSHEQRMKWDSLKRQLAGIEVGIHNLGQQLVLIQNFNYDYSTTKPDFAGQIGYGSYAPREKKAAIIEF